MNLRDLPMSGTGGPPKGLRVLGWIAMATIVATTLVTDPAAARGAARGARARAVRRRAGAEPATASAAAWAAVRRLLVLGTSSCVLAAAQPQGAGFAGIYFVMVIGGMRLDRDAAIVACGGSLAALVAVLASRATR